MANLPSLGGKHKICVICEGYEDYAYFNRLLELGTRSQVYEFLPVNAKSASNETEVQRDFTLTSDNYILQNLNQSVLLYLIRYNKLRK